MRAQKREPLNNTPIRQVPVWQRWRICTDAQRVLRTSMEAEMEEHLTDEQREGDDQKNGRTPKNLKTGEGTSDLETPRDRPSTFEPQIVRKRETILAESLEPKIIGMYGHSMSLQDIAAHIKDTYDMAISATTLSAIIDKVIPLV